MKVAVWFSVVLFGSWVIFSFGNDLVYEKSGNVSILGIFGSNCDYEGGKELQEMASAIWTIEALNNYRYLPGITIGMSLYKTCVGKAQNTALRDLIDRDLSSKNESVNIGILTTAEVYETLEPLKPAQNKRLMRVNHIMDADMFVDLTVQLLTNLQWTVVDVVASDSKNLLNSFGEKSSDEGICLRDELLINNSDSSLKVNPLSEASPVIVVIAAFSAISKLSRELLNQTGKLILVPTDFVFGFPLNGPKNAIVLLPSMERTDILSEYIKRAEQRKNFFRHRGPTKSPLFMGVASSIIKLLDPLKRLQDEHCRDINLNSKQPCIEVVDFIGNSKENKSVLLAGRSMKVSPDDIINALHVLKIDPNSNDEMFLYITSLVNANVSEDVAIFQIFSLNNEKFRPILLMIDDNLLRNREIINKSETNAERIEQPFEEGTERFVREKTSSQAFIKLVQGLAEGTKGNLKNPPERLFPPDNATLESDFPDGVRQGCQNFVKNRTKATREKDTMGDRPVAVWRFLTWVAINTSVGFMGVMCTISIMFFIASRICKGDVFEGSPYFTLLLMLAVVFVFISSLPFHIDILFNPPVICSFRINGPPLAYAVLFSLLLSRSLMLASSEGGGGFVSHINGYLQSVLCFFMFGVQVSLGLQFLIYKDANPSHCTRMHDKYKFVISLGYDLFLLALLACISPFIIRSKRNYKEGLLFSLSIFFIIVVWSVWISFYFLLPDQKDAAVAVGLNATGTALLLCVFIPRTYLMAAAIVRDRTARSLPPLDRNILSEDVNYKSNQTLNDSVFGTITYRSCEMGMSNPNFYSGKSNGSSRENTNENLNRESILDVTINTSQVN